MTRQLKNMFQRLRLGIVLAAAEFGIFTALNMCNIGICYLVGFMAGCLNFFLLILSICLVTNNKYKRPVLFYRLFFAARYLLILNLLLSIIKPDPVEIIMFCSGLLSVNSSVIISFYSFNFKTGEEG